MSERRRSLFVLLLVLGLIAASAYVVSAKKTTLGLDLQGGVQLIYEGKPTAQQPTVTQEALNRSLDIMRDRVDAFGVAEPELRLAGGNQIEVNLPGVENADRAAQQVGSTAQLFFYDWEANILDESCKPDPDQNANEKTPITGFYQATKQAAKCPRRTTTTTTPPTRRASTPSTRSPRSRSTRGSRPRARSRRSRTSSESDRKNAEVVEVPEGILVVRDQKANAERPGAGPLVGDPGQPGAVGHRDQEPEAGHGPAAADQRHVRLHGQGSEGVPGITREIAQRGVRQRRPDPAPGRTSRSTSRSSSTTS